MTLNAAAYLCEIQRAGFLSIRQNELDAAKTLNFTLTQQVKYVILPHIMKVLFPPLSNHYIIMTLGTSMAAMQNLVCVCVLYVLIRGFALQPST